MSLFENFPYTNLHELNLDWVINEINELKAGQVLSVNGQTGDVILYQDNDILFPAVTDAHWSMVRSTDGTTRGIMFGNDDKAYIVHGSTMEQIYSASNQPPYPVESVNGKTGVISLFTDNNGVVSFPAVTDPGIEGIIIGRNLNNTPIYIQLNDDGTLGFTAGVNSNEIYTTKHTKNNIIPVEEATTTESGTTNEDWGIVREVNSGSVGIMFRMGEYIGAYIRYQDTGDIWHTERLLTEGDLSDKYASNIQLSNTDNTTILQETNNLEAGAAYIETGTTASQAYTSGQFMFWKHKLYQANTNISKGDTLNDDLTSPDPVNVTEVVSGGLNTLLNVANTLQSQVKLHRFTYYAQNLTTTANGYVKICNYSDIAQNLTLQNIVSVNRFSSDITGATWFEIYTDGIYLYTSEAQTNKWIRVTIIYTDYTMTN